MLQEKVFDITCYDGLEGAPYGCRGNSMIVRVGDRVFATFNHQERNRMPYNRTCLEIYEKKGDSVWKLAFRDEGVYQMDPSPIMYLGDNRLAVTANLTVARYAADEVCKMVPCTPVVYIFDITEELKRVEVITLPYDAPAYQFVDHCYRSCTRDIENGICCLPIR